MTVHKQDFLVPAKGEDFLSLQVYIFTNSSKMTMGYKSHTCHFDHISPCLWNGELDRLSSLLLLGGRWP